MYTTIKIEVHCADDKEVEFVHTDVNGEQRAVFQDGDEHEAVVFDDISVSIREINKD